MEQTDTTATDSSARRQRSPELIRPTDGRVLAGVAKGIADNFGISEWIPRVVFVATAFMGGLGVILYAAGWAFLRSEDETESPAERFFTGAPGVRSWIGIGLLLLAAVIVLDNFTFLAGEVVWAAVLLVAGLLLYTGLIPVKSGRSDAVESPTGDESGSRSNEGVQQVTTTEIPVATDTGDSPAGGGEPPRPAATPPILPPIPSKPRDRSILGRLTIGVALLGMGVLAILDQIPGVPIDADPRHYLALGVTIIGVGLIVGAFVGRARWLILVGAILLPTLVFSPVFEYDWNSDAFDRRVSPQTFAELDEVYSVDVGSLQIDLSDLPWDGETVELEARVNAGNLEIRIPADVALRGDASVNVGRVSAPGRESVGLGNPQLTFSEDDRPTGTVLLDAEVDVGNIDIRRNGGTRITE